MKTEKIKKSSNNPLGTEDVTKLLIRYSVPAIISMLVSALYNIVDQIFIGQSVGTLGMAATNVAFPLTTISTAGALLLGVGGAANFNLYLGAEDEDKAINIASNALALMVVMGVIIGGFAIGFMQPLLKSFGATDKVLPLATTYTEITAFGLPLFIFSSGASHIIRADGNPNYSMFSMMAGALLNIVLDYIFIFPMNMGMAGAAWATVLGQLLSTILTILYFAKYSRYIKPNIESFRPKFIYMQRIATLGASACFNQLAMTVVQITMNNTLTFYGAQSKYGSEIPLAAVGAVSKLLVVLMAFVIGISQGSQPITGYNYGAKKYDRVKKAYITALKGTTVVSVIAFLIFQLFPREIMSIFGSGTEEYFEFATKYLKVFMMLTFFNGLQPVAAMTFTAIGKASLGFWMSLVRQIIPQVPLILILPRFFGIDGIMYAGPLADGTAAILAGYFLVRETKELNLLQEEQEGRIKLDE